MLQPSAPGDPIPVTKKVSVKVDGNKIVSVDPQVSFVRLGGSIDFVAEGLADGYSVEIDYRVDGGRKGPFLANKGEPRGRLTLRPGATAATLRYDDALRQTAVWKYDVTLRNQGTDVAALDPMTVGKGDG